MRRRFSLGLALGAILLATGCEKEGQDASRSEPDSARVSESTAPSSTPPATPPSGTAGVLQISWVAPTTNTDGSPLTDLALYRLYYGSAGTPCPGSNFLQVASPTPSPQTNETVTYTLTGLLAGVRYFAAVTAVDLSDLESACSSVANAVARSDSGSASGLVGSIAGSGATGWSPVAIQVPVLTGLTAELGPQLPGTTVTFTAIAAEGTAPYQFKWWLWDGATWTVLGDWSSGNTLAWTPSTPNPNYTVGVRVRSAYSTADQPDSYPGNTRASRVIDFAINYFPVQK